MCVSVSVSVSVVVALGVGVGVDMSWCVFVYLDSLQVDCVHHSALKKGHCGIVTLQQSL